MTQGKGGLSRKSHILLENEKLFISRSYILPRATYVYILDTTSMTRQNPQCNDNNCIETSWKDPFLNDDLAYISFSRQTNYKLIDNSEAMVDGANNEDDSS